MKKRIGINFIKLLLFFVITFPQFIFSQGKESDDDYIYDIVAPKTLELDFDFYYDKYTRGSSSSGKNVKLGVQADLKYYNAPTLTVRYGLLKNLELQVVTGFTGVITNGTVNVKTRKNILLSATKDESGISGLGLGFKAGLLTNKKARPSVSFTGIFTLPGTGSKTFTPNKTGVDLSLNFYNLISDEIDVAYNIGTVWSGYDNDPNTAIVYGISPGYSFTDNFSLYVDFNGIFQKGYAPDNRIDLDLSFNLNDYLTLDLYGGTSFNIKKFFFIGSTFTATIPF